jgi:hypothetical protein
MTLTLRRPVLLLLFLFPSFHLPYILATLFLHFLPFTSFFQYTQVGDSVLTARLMSLQGTDWRYYLRWTFSGRRGVHFHHEATQLLFHF